MDGWKRYVYLTWVALAIILQGDYIPALTEFFGNPIVDLQVGYIITPWRLYTAFVLVFSSWVIGETLRKMYEMAIKSSLTTWLAGLIVLLGTISFIDLVYAKGMGNTDLFLVEMIYDALVDPTSLVPDQVLSVVDIQNNVSVYENESMSVL